MSIRVDQPREFDLVGNPVLVAGIGTGFEATLNYRIHEGHDQRDGHFMVGGGTGEHSQFQIQVDLNGAAFMLPRLFVEVFDPDPSDGTERDKVIIPVIYGPLLVEGYIGYREHVVRPGDTLGAIAATHYGDAGLYWRISGANPTQIGDPDLIFPGQVLRVPIGA